VDLIEVLLTAATHRETFTFEDGSICSNADLIVEARALLDNLRPYGHISQEVVILNELADLEAGIDLDWDSLDEAYYDIIGKYGVYLRTVVSSISNLREYQSDRLEHITDLVRDDFTSPGILRKLGWLYFRRSNLGKSPDPIADYKKAYEAFDACRILEGTEMTYQRESVVTSYQRGRAILAASILTNDPTPFQADLNGKQSLIHLAESLFGRTVALTVGQFHEEARRRHGEAARMRKILETDSR
jgi:hypothetical protein